MPMHEIKPTGHEAEARSEAPRIARETQEEQDDRSGKRNKLHRAPPKRGRRDPIIFSDDDLPDGPTPHRDAILIVMDVNGATVRRVFVDTGSSVNVMYLETFTKLGLTKENLHQVRTPLVGFTGNSIEPEGCITLTIEIGEYPRVRAINMEFVVVDLKSAHNIILERPGLEDLGAVVSLEHLCLKFRTPEGVGTIICDRQAARSCYLLACRQIGSQDLQV
ncbi:uncharacterized protein LOC116019673 [Ipomoea triloba]|uniref:uncharacterized protein LOC116019673 n=1 Tax=Ipomoea triloba TaxID=35885 RepID=UPI00125CF971|nr:uncharacterized protein LOC116019673 [Ipomoea triloba]